MIAQSKTVPEFLRDGRYRHVVGVLDEEPPLVLRKLIPLLSSKVEVDTYVVDKVRDLARRGPVVYAMKYRSLFDLHFLRMRLAQLGLPVPSYTFGLSPGETGSLSKWTAVRRHRLVSALREGAAAAERESEVVGEILQQGGAAVLFLVDEKTTRTRYVHPNVDPIRMLLDLQGKMAASLAVIPMFILYDRRQPRSIRPFWESFLGDPDLPGPLRRLLGRFRKWTVPELLIGEPSYLVGEFEEFGSDISWEELPFKVRQELIDSINARIRVNRGPERLSRTEIKERVLQDSRVQRAVRDSVSGESLAEERVRKNAESYVDEIAANQRIQVHHFLFYVLKGLFAKVFDGIDLRQSDFTALKKTNQEHSLIYVSCHKSHFDYLLIGFLSFINQMAIPYMAAGRNLSFWPVGPILRNAGAFFIRRSFKGLSLYPHVFAAYLRVLVKEKININFYIEGGRSRTGKLLPPRVGMLAFLLQTLEEGAVDDLIFVPTFIGYDQIPEEKSYLRELAGREKQTESLSALIRAREVLGRKFGKVYVRFHEPVSFKDFWVRSGIEGEPGTLSLRESRRMLNDFAYYLMSGIVRVGVVSPTDLVAAALVWSGGRKSSRRLVLEAVGWLTEALRFEGIQLAPSLESPDAATETALGLFRVRGFIDLKSDGNEHEPDGYLIRDDNRANLDFYRNSLVNYLWPESLVSMALLKGAAAGGVTGDQLFEDFRFLNGLISKELILDPLVEDRAILDKTMAFFTEKSWMTGSAAEGWQVVDRRPLECFRGILSDLVWVYYLVLATSVDVEERIGQKDYIRKMMKTEQESLPAQQGRAMPSLATVTVGNALARFHEMGIFEYRQGRKVLARVSDPVQGELVRESLSPFLDWPVSGGGQK